MRLLEYHDDEFHLTDDLYEHEIPPYAILSHTWGHRSDEVTFSDIVNGEGQHKAGYRKIRFCHEKAAIDGLEYFWVDSCCIDKSSSAELQESLNLMFRWYERAERCYVYLADVPMAYPQDIQSRYNDFPHSRWFTRGWTLQELLAPRELYFFDQNGELLGSKKDLEPLIHSITGIDVWALQGLPMSVFEVRKRFSWAEHRRTTRPEDEAYCLFGILGVYMPVMYGEGKEHAMRRLRRTIKNFGTDFHYDTYQYIE